MPITLHRSRAAAAALVLWAMAAPAAAQEPGEFQSERIPGWSFVPALAAGVVHDSNVALSSPRADLGATQGDALVALVPSGQIEYLGKRTEFSVGYRGFLRRYMEVEGLDTFAQRGSLSFQRALSRRVTMFARNNFSDSPTTDEVEVNGVPFRRTGSRTNTFAAGADVRLSKFTTLASRYDLTWVSFDRDDELASVTGGWIHGISTELTRQLSERLRFGGEYSYRTASLDQGEREFGFQDAGAVLRYALGPHTAASAGAGLSVLHDRNAGRTPADDAVTRELAALGLSGQPVQAAEGTRIGPYFRLGIDHRLEHVVVGGSFERQFVPSFGFGGASSSRHLRGYVRMPLVGPRVYVQGSAAWRRSVPFEVETLEVDTVWLRSAVGFAASRWARMEALYTYTRQDSIITGGEVDRHRVGAQVVISQPMRIP
jgi:hypothetical protein